MRKHTQGPWFSGHKCEISGWVDIYSIEADGGKSLPFAACKHHDPEANARLIALSPEMLDALIWHRDALDLGDVAFYEKHGFITSEVMPRTRAIVKKAEGSIT